MTKMSSRNRLMAQMALDGASYLDISQQFGVTTERVRSILAKAGMAASQRSMTLGAILADAFTAGWQVPAHFVAHEGRWPVICPHCNVTSHRYSDDLGRGCVCRLAGRRHPLERRTAP